MANVTLTYSYVPHNSSNCIFTSTSTLSLFHNTVCFLGSAAYPQENEYKQYLAQHGGKSNASTSASHTTYQFDVLAEFGEKALDIFGNFFIGPLFTKSGTAREIHAVDSENSKNLVNDGRRRWQVLKSLADEEHHFSKFSTGNAITLPASAGSGDERGKEDINGKADTVGAKSSSVGTESSDGINTDKHPLEDILSEVCHDCGKEDMAEFVRIALLAFHKRHYRPQNMSVVIVGPQSLDELESWAVPRFGKIPDRWTNDDNEISCKSEEVNDEEVDAPEKKEKLQKMKQLAARLIDEGAAAAPPVSVAAAKSVKHQSSFRPELQGGKWPVVVTTKPCK